VDDLQLTVEWDRGVLVSTEEERVCFDPQRRGEEFDGIFISHSHGDHTAAFSNKARKYSTLDTRRIFEARSGIKVENFKTAQYDRSIEVGSLEVISRNAGHMLGSTQFEIHTPEETIVYTGDINCVDTLTTKAATPIDCDILIMETTYGEPAFLFPRREEVYVDITKWAISKIKNGEIPTFEVYSVGKAQEIVALINHFTELPVVVSPTISRVNEVHLESGVELHYVGVDSHEGKDMLDGGTCCYVVPTRSRQDLPKNAARATATGWSIRFRPRNHMGFPLSSHADFNQLISYVKEAKPEIVYTCFGRSEILSHYVERKTGIKSLPLKNKTNLHSSKRKRENREIKPNVERMLDFMVMPGFVYKKNWMINKLTSFGVSPQIAQKVLNHMEKEGIISYEKEFAGYRLT
jgi:putative mRNA 3-end processing factor